MTIGKPKILTRLNMSRRLTVSNRQTSAVRIVCGVNTKTLPSLNVFHQGTNQSIGNKKLNDLELFKNGFS